MNKWSHDTIMPNGKYKDYRLAQIPAYYFVWLFDIYGINRESPLGIYLSENIEEIREKDKADQIARKKQFKNNAR